MTRLTISKAKAELTDIVNRAVKTKERTVLSRRGKGIAAVVPIEDLRLLEHLTQEEMDRQDLEDARRALAEGGKRVPLADFIREIGD
jgi:prevent-host-death family protein